ncbi:helix-turn-helix domain-containing protein [Fimbriimonas ginsengisoli]|uniref:DNA binding domain-containing protein n=1 Tax=Fimbriimonas ginsengisoli Gsoil 348 TaxID=661478 RepID=A0A068NS53_FIMGI|nr:helix-turn-helix domain-containing protein [Fimbriimonas ginsengisoli]AIE86172.1 DNA binding domain-containing protein [Fimbriimonas ginsengisoli Gsoil 348]
MRTNNFDPLAYIESAFLDKEGERDEHVEGRDLDTLTIPSITDYLTGGRASISIVDPREDIPEAGEPEKRAKFRKTVMSAPRPRRSRKLEGDTEQTIDPELRTVWQALPKNVAFLCSFYDDSVTKNYYRGEFKETRQDLIRRLLDPELSLEETSRLLGVCPATVRRYTNRGWLAHHRTTGGQRRFRLSDVVKFVDEHGRFPEE